MFSSRSREVLIKAIIHTPSEIHSLTAQFWWGGDDSSKKINWLKWSVVKTSKFDGGLGFRDIECFNQALIARQAWRNLQNCPL